MAEQVCRNALDVHHHDGNLLCLLGASLMRQRKPRDAEEPLRTAISMFPEFTRAHEELGAALMVQGRYEEAVETLRRAVDLEPDSASALLKLGRALGALGKGEEADEVFEKSFRLTPHRTEMARALEQQRLGNLDKAERIYREIIKQDPHQVDALRFLAQIAVSAGQWGDAEALLKRVVDEAPDHTSAWNDLVDAYREQDKYEEAIEVCRRALRLDPNGAHFHCQLGNIYTSSGRYEEAIAAFERAIEVNENHFGSMAGLGHALKTVGRQDEAIASYRCCIAAAPGYGEAYWSLANLKTFRFEESEIREMKQLIENEDMPDEPRVNFLFALGKACEDRGDYEKAFDYYHEGNAIRRMNEDYDPVQTEVTNDSLIEVFSKELLERNSGSGDPTPAPIFILGLPRSGSTLIEQILASHSQVEGTYEMPEVSRVIRHLNSFQVDGQRYPEVIPRLNANNFRELGALYLERTSTHRQSAPFFTDKMPNNFPSVGFIHLILPNAKIINTRRHPLDSCMGNYKQLYAKGQSWSYDLMDIGEYYLEYLRMMDHWRSVLPGRVLDIEYEDMVADQETQIRRLIDYCELPWEDACLRFHETKRAVRTASSEQVRQPIYTKSVHAWRRFESRLAPLIEVLEPVLASLPEEDRPARLP